ncbi:PAS domain S-box protein [Crenalkalicoccus roseus]|uniref:PAS domain S-box protein n=1 Tax=Crenalkalicoccus roseus TaxID=1485588 RepID=UPI0010803ED5|nr:PAS domain S-box protein [Crenalkalicoccus roseus]
MPDEGLPSAPEFAALRHVAEGSAAASILLGGPMLRILYANAAFCEAADAEVQALAGRPAGEVLPLTEGHLRLLERIRASGRPWRRGGVPLRLHPGRPARLWEVEAIPLPAGPGAAPDLFVQLRDITARERALREGEAARATLDALFAHFPEGLLLAEGRELRIRRISARGLALSGYGAEEVVGRGAATPPVAAAVLRADGAAPARPEELPLPRAVRRGEAVRHEAWVLRRKDGARVPVLCSAGPIRDAAGRVAGGILVWQDATELRRAEAALAASEARYRALANAWTGAVWTAGPDGALRDTAEWSALTGQPAEAARGWGWLDAVHPEDRERVRRCWEEALAREKTYEAEYRLAQGEDWRWTAARAVPVRDAAGRIVEWVGANADIHPRKMAEAALRASQERFRILAEAMPHLVWQADRQGAPEYMNRRMQAFTGMTPTEARGRDWRSLIHPEDAPRFEAAWRQALAESVEFGLDLRLATPEGGWRWFDVQGAPVRDAEGRIRHWVGTCTDVEDRRRAEAAMQEALAAQEKLLRTAEHRIKNSLQLVASLLRLKAGRVAAPAAREALEEAVARVQAVAEAHRALQRSPDMRNVRLADMMQELAAGVAVLHPGADLRVEADPSLLLDADRAIPLALALKELLGAALGRNGRERPPPALLSARTSAEGIEVVVACPADPGEPEALSATIIRALVRQIGATLATEASAEGVRTVLRLPEAHAPG